MNTKPIRLIIVDDQQYHVSVTSEMLSRHDMFGVVGTAKNEGEMYKHLKLQKQLGEMVDIILLDIEMPEEGGKDGTGIAKDLLSKRSEYFGVKVVCFSVNSQTHVLRSLLRDIGVHGYLDKHEVNHEELMESLISVHEGAHPVVSSSLKKELKQILDSNPEKKGIETLTKMERIILPFIAEGLLDENISEHLFENDLSKTRLSKFTIRNHRFNIRDKLNCERSEQIAAIYFDYTRLHGNSRDELPKFKKK